MIYKVAIKMHKIMMNFALANQLSHNCY